MMNTKWKIVPVLPTEEQRLAGMNALPINAVQHTEAVYAAMVGEPVAYPISEFLSRLRELAEADEVPVPYRHLASEIINMLVVGDLPLPRPESAWPTGSSVSRDADGGVSPVKSGLN